MKLPERDYEALFTRLPARQELQRAHRLVLPQILVLAHCCTPLFERLSFARGVTVVAASLAHGVCDGIAFGARAAAGLFGGSLVPVWRGIIIRAGLAKQPPAEQDHEKQQT